MREFASRPVMLALTLVLIIGAIAAIEVRLGGASGERADTDRQAEAVSKTDQGANREEPVRRASTGSAENARGNEQVLSDAERIASKESEYERAPEITGSTGFVNTDGVSLGEAVGEKVVLVEFWTYSCFNCQNAQPHINALHDKYEDDGLLVVGVHTPEFGFEKDISNVREAVRQANIEYPVVLDNNYAIWSAWGQRYWPAWYLIDADGFIRYRHFGEGAYEETDQKVRELVSERNRISG